MLYCIYGKHSIGSNKIICIISLNSLAYLASFGSFKKPSFLKQFFNKTIKTKILTNGKPTL